MASLGACSNAGSEDSQIGGKADGDDEPRVELKVTIDAADLERARELLKLHDGNSEKRQIWFYDTRGLDLFEAGAILRVRHIKGDTDDATVKLRPFSADMIAASWFELDGFKCELDRSPDRQTSSCSLTVDDDALGDAAEEVAEGRRDVDALFSADQKDLLTTHAASDDADVLWSDLLPLGPLPARVWKVEDDALPGKLTAELWDMPDLTQVLELSMKVPVDDGDDALEDLVKFVDDLDLDISSDQETKTRRALELLASSSAP